MPTPADTPDSPAVPADFAHRYALAFIFVTVLIDVIGFGIVIPVLPRLVMSLGHVGIGDAARLGGWLMFSYSVMQFVFGPVFGGLSDRYGRRPILLSSLAAFGLDYLAMGFAPTLGWLFAGRVVAGITGASFNSAYAYIADVTPPERRTQNFGLIGFAFGIGFIVGPALGGLLAGFGTRTPFFVAAALALTNVAYGYFILPESLAHADRRPFDWRRANVWVRCCGCAACARRCWSSPARPSSGASRRCRCSRCGIITRWRALAGRRRRSGCRWRRSECRRSSRKVC